MSPHSFKSPPFERNRWRQDNRWDLAHTLCSIGLPCFFIVPHQNELSYTRHSAYGPIRKSVCHPEGIKTSGNLTRYRSPKTKNKNITNTKRKVHGQFRNLWTRDIHPATKLRYRDYMQEVYITVWYMQLKLVPMGY